MLEPQSLFELSDALIGAAILATHAKKNSAVLIGLAGPQGSGKSTTAERVGVRLTAAGLRTVILSLDNFYLPRSARQNLASQVHPLLVTRGVPGTHDMDLLDRTMEALQSATPTSRIRLPAFDKIADDRRAHDDWSWHGGRVEVIILEGWCVGARPQAEAALIEPINDLEREEDADGAWRRHVNRELTGRYASAFSRLDLKILFRAPDFAVVHKWRDEQEERLAQAEGRSRSMDAPAIARFIAHYERLTRWMMEDEPADLVVDIDADRLPRAWRVPARTTRGTD